jgi:DNA end-binding protein Ku
MRAIWSGSLSFGLINIPVKLYSATAGTGIDLVMLHKKDTSPIRYARICRADGKEVPWEEIVKGYEYQKGDYVVLTEEDFKKARVEKTNAVEIESFIKESEIDPIYFEKPYFLEPEKGAEKAYALLRESLKISKKIGLAKFVLRNREHLAVIRPEGVALVLEQMRYDEEIKNPSELHLPDAKKAGNREVEIALALIHQLTEHFNPKKYKDTYTDELKKIATAKAKGKPIKSKAGREPKSTEVSDILTVLKKSLQKEKAKAS